MTTGTHYGLNPSPHHGLSGEALSSVLPEIIKKPEISAANDAPNTCPNASFPVNRLPDELFVEVFLYVQTGDRFWPRLLVVCRRWRAVALMSARLWCRLDVGVRTPHARITASLENSGNLPLDVTLYRKVHVPAALKALTPHRARTRTLHLVEARRTESPDILAFLRASMPALQTLQVAFRPYIDESYRFNQWSEEDEPDEEAAFCFSPMPDQFPSLEELSLRAVELRAVSVSFPRITTLRLTDCIYTDVSLQTFLSMLSGLGELASLFIRRYRPIIGNSPRYNLPPTLQTLSLEDDIRWTHAYMAHLILPPNLNKLSVTKHAVPDVPEEGLLSVQPIYTCLPLELDRTVRAILRDVESVRLDLVDSYNWLSVVGTAGTRTVSLAAVAMTRCIMEPNPVHDLIVLFNEGSVTDLQIFGVGDRDEHQTTEDDWGLMLWHLWSLKRLALT
ncbi:hypothetical protein K466DRAFT_596944, partial [Polyporus arcularius HHB13444]